MIFGVLSYAVVCHALHSHAYPLWWLCAYTHQEHEALPDNGHADLDHYVPMHSAQQCKFHQKTSHKQRPVPAPSSGYAHPCRRNQTHPRLR